MCADSDCLKKDLDDVKTVSYYLSCTCETIPTSRCQIKMTEQIFFFFSKTKSGVKLIGFGGTVRRGKLWQPCNKYGAHCNISIVQNALCTKPFMFITKKRTFMKMFFFS